MFHFNDQVITVSNGTCNFYTKITSFTYLFFLQIVVILLCFLFAKIKFSFQAYACHAIYSQKEAVP